MWLIPDWGIEATAFKLMIPAVFFEGRLIWVLDSAAGSLLRTESQALVHHKDIQSSLSDPNFDLISGTDRGVIGS